MEKLSDYLVRDVGVVKPAWRSRISLIWALLVGATLLSWQLGRGLGFDNPFVAGCAILTVTFIKARWWCWTSWKSVTRPAGFAPCSRPGAPAPACS